MHEQRTGKPDRHPSWSINQYTYSHFCFSCGYKGTLTSLIIDVTGEAPEDLEKTLAKEGFIRKMAEARQDPATVLEPVNPDAHRVGPVQHPYRRTGADAFLSSPPTSSDQRLRGPLGHRDEALGPPATLDCW